MTSLSKIVYILIFVLASITAYTATKTDKASCTIRFATQYLFAVVYILRTRVGTDWSVYADYYNKLNDPFIVEQYGFEKGYYLLNKIFELYHANFQLIIVVLSVFFYACFLKGTQKLKINPDITFLLALLYLFYPSLEALRQSVGIFIFYYSLQYINQDQFRIRKGGVIFKSLNYYKGKVQYIMVNVSGILFHRGSITTFVYYFYQSNRLIKIIIVGGCVLFDVFRSHIEQLLRLFPGLFQRYSIYVTDHEIAPVFSLKLIEYIIIFFILISFRDKNKNERISLDLIEIGILIQVFISKYISATYRILYFCDIGIILFYSTLYERIKKKRAKVFYITFVIIYVGVRFYRAFPFNNEAFSYHFIF